MQKSRIRNGVLKMTRIRLGLALLVLLCATGQAIGQDAPDEQSARMHNKLGLEYVDQGKFLQAIDEFKNAYQAHPSSKYLSNIGRACELIGRLSEALYYYERAAAETNNINRKERLANAIDSVRKRLAVLTVSVTPPASVVEVDGNADLCKPSVPCYLDPGEYQIKVSATGYDAETRKVKLEPGERWNEEVKLARSGTVLTVESNIKGAAVFLDGKLVGRTPVTTEDISPGTHKLRVEARDAPPQEKTFVARKGELASFRFTLEKRVEITRGGVVWRSVVFPGFGQLHAGNKTAGVLFLTGEALCIVGTGVGLGLRSWYLQQRQGTAGTTYNDWTNLARTSEWVAIGAGSAGLLLWGINVIHAASTPLPKDRKHSWNLFPLLSPDMNGAIFSLSF